eukprot:CAMPEP_0168227564 /NCGR_PEP_ID=MMETSP0140_2-20121125/14115_1 /TAXON_ID=44445 /ORGANISM="Pseudo-nitzschia australis, Strain 10249 10 AB" /LENGTH=39 /DNA_ID= /DNA_START= /DNA_END= /DNA_ORIENTATION=
MESPTAPNEVLDQTLVAKMRRTGVGGGEGFTLDPEQQGR